MTNTLKLQLENFQSISAGELEFVTGLNFIIGQSNSGKSATFRALKACLCNPSGSQRFIKKGNTKTSVTLEYNGNSITWVKTPKENKYEINGETYLKTGTGSAFKLLPNETGFVQGEPGVVMNIEEELQLPFPFGYNKSELFKLYENVFCISDSAVILKSAKEHEGKVKFDIDMLEVELDKNKTKLEELGNFKKEVNFSEIKRCLSDCKKVQERLDFLKDNLDVIKIALKVSEIPLPTVDINWENELFKYKECMDLKRTVSQLEQYHKLSKSIPTSLTLSEEPINKLRELNDLKGTAKQIEVLSDIKIPEVAFTNFLADFKERTELFRIFRHLKELHDIKISEEVYEDRLNYYKALLDYKKSLEVIKEKIQIKSDQLKEVEKNIVDLNEELKEYKVCPLCHRPLEGEEIC